MNVACGPDDTGIGVSAEGNCDPPIDLILYAEKRVRFGLALTSSARSPTRPLAAHAV